MSREVTGRVPQARPRRSPSRARLTSVLALAVAGVGAVGLYSSGNARTPPPVAVATRTPAPSALPRGPSALPRTPTSESPSTVDAQPSAADGPPPWVVGDVGTPVTEIGEGLTAQLELVGRDSADFQRLQVRLLLGNPFPRTVPVTSVSVVGLGTTLVDVPAGTVLPPRGTVWLGATVIADCIARLIPAVRVVVDTTDESGIPTQDVAAIGVATAFTDVLAPLCPPVRAGLAVAITGVHTDLDGGFTVRMVNNGTLAATVVPIVGPGARGVSLLATPPGPWDLVPGEAVLLRLRVEVSGCPAPPRADALAAIGLEARLPQGYTAVRGWPIEATAKALDAAAAVCRAAAVASSL